MSAPLLDGVRILDLTRVMSGPFCTSMLADLGAEVIKVELPKRGDEARSFGPFRDGDSAYFMLLNRNKRSISLDMKAPDGIRLIRALLPRCDVLVENFRPGVMGKLGLDYDQVKSVNPRLIYASISGFGQSGPLSGMPAFDLVIQAMSGLMSLTGPRGGPPTAVGESIADVAAGMFAAWGICAALFARERTGEGRHIDVSMLDAIVSMQLTGLSRQLYLDETPQPVGNRHPVTYPVDSFPTKTGDIVLVCFSDQLFRTLSKLIGRPEWADDPRFSTNKARNANEDALRDQIGSWTRTQTAEHAVELLLKSGIPAAPVWDLRKLMDSPHTGARKLVVRGHHSRLGDVPLVPQPVKFSDAPEVADPSTPVLGEDTDSVLSDLLGLSAEELAELRDKGVI